MTDQQYVQKEDLTLRELIIQVKEYWRELWKNWWLIALAIIPVAGYMAYKTYKTPVKYITEVRFIVEGEGGGGSQGGLGSLLGSFGIRKSGDTNPYKILEVAKSKRMIANVLLSNPENEEDCIGNKIIETYKLDERWAEESPEMAGFRFTSDTIESFDVVERIAFLSLFHKTVGSAENRANALIQVVLDEETGIFSVIGSTEDEGITLDLVNNLYEEVKFFFEEQVLVGQKQTRDLLKEKADSLEAIIGQKTLQIARFEDSSLGLISNERAFEKEKLRLEIQGLISAYSESLRTYEVADYSYKDSKPLFLVIDQPYAPLRPFEESYFDNILLGIVIGVFLGGGFVVARKIYRDAMSKN